MLLLDTITTYLPGDITEIGCALAGANARCTAGGWSNVSVSLTPACKVRAIHQHE